MSLIVRSFIETIKPMDIELTFTENESIESLIVKALKRLEKGEKFSLDKLTVVTSVFDKSSNKIQDTEVKDLSIKASSLPKDTFVSITPKNIGSPLETTKSIFFSYAVPCILVLSFYLRLTKPNYTQTAAMIISVLHYCKRAYETVYVNTYHGRFDFSTLFGLIGYYWGLFGVLVSYSIYYDSYESSSSLFTVALLFVLQLVCEYNNFACHRILQKLKIENKGKRGLPTGNLYDYVSSAHYFWELLSWFVFFLQTKTFFSGLFVITSFSSMTILALEKHKSYVELFGEKIKGRKVIIPFLI